jgi:hypothetical protein
MFTTSQDYQAVNKLHACEVANPTTELQFVPTAVMASTIGADVDRTLL